MIEVLSLKYGPVFKRVFSRPEVFTSFTSAVLGIPIKVERIETEYEYPKPVGFVKSRYDLFAEDIAQRIIVEIQQVKDDDFFDRFLYYHLISMIEQVRGFQAYWFGKTVYTIVVLTSIPKDKSIAFSCAISDFSPIDEHGEKVPVYPHRLIFLTPRLVNADTPPELREWLEFIKDSLDGKMDETLYQKAPFCSMLEQMRQTTMTPKELAAIMDDAVWEKAKADFAALERIKGEVKGKIELLKRQLTHRFGALPEWAEQRIDTANMVQLEVWAEEIFNATDVKSLLM